MKRSVVTFIIALMGNLAYGQIIEIDYSLHAKRVFTIEKKGLMNSTEAAQAHTQGFLSVADAQKSLLNVQDSKILRAKVKNCYEGKFSSLSTGSYAGVYSCIVEFKYKKL